MLYKCYDFFFGLVNILASVKIPHCNYWGAEKPYWISKNTKL